MKMSALAAVMAGLSILTPIAQAAGNAGAGGGDVHAQMKLQDQNGGGQRLAGGRGGISGDVYLPPKSSHRMFAGGRGGIGGDVLLHLDTHTMFAGGRGGMTGDTGNDRIAAVIGSRLLMLAASRPGMSGDF